MRATRQLSYLRGNVKLNPNNAQILGNATALLRHEKHYRKRATSTPNSAEGVQPASVPQTIRTVRFELVYAPQGWQVALASGGQVRLIYSPA